jgi:hypothetical protein
VRARRCAATWRRRCRQVLTRSGAHQYSIVH